VLTCYALFIIDFFLGLLWLSFKVLAVGAPGSPGLRMRSPDPAAIRLRFA